MDADIFSRCEKEKIRENPRKSASSASKKMLRSNKIHPCRKYLDAEIYFRRRFKQDFAEPVPNLLRDGADDFRKRKKVLSVKDGTGNAAPAFILIYFNS